MRAKTQIIETLQKEFQGKDFQSLGTQFSVIKVSACKSRIVLSHERTKERMKERI